jgi:hypothetical protein
VERLSDRQFNLKVLAPPPPLKKEPAQAPSAAAPPAWTARVTALTLDGFDIDARELAPSGGGDILLGGISLALDKVSTRAGDKAGFRLDLSVNKTGSVKTRGEVCLDPVSATVAIDAGDLSLAWAQPFLKDHLNAIVSSGKLRVSGNATLSPGAPGAAPRMSFTGDTSIKDLAVTEKKEAAKLLGWKDLSLTGLDLASEPRRASIREVTLTAPYGRLGIEADGGINLRHLLKPGPAAPPAPTGPAAPTAPGSPAPGSGHAPLPIDIGSRSLCPTSRPGSPVSPPGGANPRTSPSRHP